MRNWWGAVIGAVLILLGGALAWYVQTSGGSVKVTEVRFPAPGGQTIAGLMYRPADASPEHPAPAVLVSHGLINTREMQSPFAIELSRRGYVVLAMDMSGHGYSTGVLGQNAHGGPAAFSYLASQPFVDKTRIGLEGHSLGGAPTQAAARANPAGYRAIVLEGSSPSIARIGARPGADQTPFKPTNLALVFGQYDEFAQTMWGVKRGSELPKSPRVKALFGTTEDVVPGRVYGSIADGTARRLTLPAINHPQEHFTKAGVGAAVDWFNQTMPAPHAIAATDQVWLWKEIGTLVGFIGCVTLILGVFAGLAGTMGALAPANDAEAPVERRGGKWLLAAVLTAAIPAIAYFPVMQVGQRWFINAWKTVGLQDFALKTFPQQVTNQLVVWALVSGVVALALSFVVGGRKTNLTNRWVPAIVAAVVSVGAGYLALVVVDAVFKVDFRFWVLGLKPLDGRHFGIFLVYLPFFLVFFLLSARSYARSLPVRGEGALAAGVTAAVATALGFIVMLAYQYGSMHGSGVLPIDQPLLTIVAYQFIPLLMVIGVIFAVTFRKTGGYAAGALICALFITWYIVGGTAIYPPTAPRPPGARPPATNAPAANAPAMNAPAMNTPAVNAPAANAPALRASTNGA